MSKEVSKKEVKPRPPIVVILGHVDHGKTTILDTIRESKIVDKEAGGITQHIGAYQVENDGKTITFLDTPGHEAFSAIRLRGAKIADVAVLVVAADEGIKPQTKESIKLLKESNTPFVVAINKIDKDGSNPMKIRQELAEKEVLVEDYGGQVPVAEISARNNQGLDHLLEIIQLVSELEELTEDPKRGTTGVVIESHMDSKVGIIATLLVQNGILKTSDWITAGSSVARVKSLEDFQGNRIESASASQPCVVTGWESLPALGSIFELQKDKKTAQKNAKAHSKDESKLFQSDESTEFVANLIVKADVQSSLDAIDQTLGTIKSEKVSYKVMSFGVGNISDSDIKQAKTMDATIVGFHVEIDKSAREMAERGNIRVEKSDIIYKLVEAVRSVMADLLPIEIERNSIGKLKILATFGSSGKAQVVGGKIIKGKAVRGSAIDVIRSEGVVGSGKLGQLQQGKQDVTEVKEGLECGIRFDPIDDSEIPQIAVGDILEFFQEKKTKQEL